MSGIGAVLGRIAAIEARLGVRPTTTPPRAATTPAPPTSPSPALVDGRGGNGFAELLHQDLAPRAATAGALGAVGAAAGVTATRRTVATPTGGPIGGANAAWSPAPGVPGGVGTTGPGGARVLPPDTPFAQLFERAGERWGIAPQVLAAVGHVESRFRTDAVSPAGAEGVMQFMPATAASMGVDPWDPTSAIDGAARMLRELQDRFGSLELALGAYNVGPGTIARSGGIVPGSQAERYVGAVLRATEQFS